MNIYIIIFLLLLLFLFTDFSKTSQRNKVLFFIGVCITFFIGLRNETGTDSATYISFFKYQTNTLWDWENIDKGYSEYGFYFLSVFVKSLINDVDFYFTVISLITVSFLFKSLKNYCLFPILGFLVYFSRFMLIRDMNQIRQALAIAIIIYAIRFLCENKKKTFIVFLLISTLMHYSSIIILPFIWLYKIKLSTKQCFKLIIITALLGVTLGTFLKKNLISTNNIVLLNYINTNNLGITNPVILYQIILCLSFFYYENILKDIQPGYYIIRNAFLYSILLLLSTCNLGEIGGRLATIFATCEIFIIPALVRIIRPQLAGYIIFTIICGFLFWMNITKLDPYFWTYFK